MKPWGNLFGSIVGNEPDQGTKMNDETEGKRVTRSGNDY